MQRPLVFGLTLWIGLAAGPAAAYERASVEGKPGVLLYWVDRSVTYHLHAEGSADAQLTEVLGAIKRSFFTWASPSCTDVYFTPGELADTDATNLSSDTPADRRNTIVWREDRWQGGPVDDTALTADMAARTTLVYDLATGEIIDADIDVNGVDFFWTTTDDPTKAATDIQNVMTHEIGHLLGLDHSDNAQATMHQATSQSELDKRTLHDDDLAGLCAIYPHGQPTPRGPKQPPPNKVVQGASSGCVLGAGPVTLRRALPLTLLALLWLLRPRRRTQAMQRGSIDPRRRGSPPQ